jgi:hypothetical protein
VFLEFVAMKVFAAATLVSVASAAPVFDYTFGAN